MQLKKTKLAKQISLAILGFTLISSATADTFTASVTTLDDVQINTITGLDFGTNMFTATSQTCILDAAIPGNITMQYATTGVIAEHADFGDLSGSGGCITGNKLGTPGIYSISGATAGAVNILISQVSPQPDGDYTFVPSGCYVNFDGTTTDDADVCAIYTAGTPLLAQELADVTGTEDNTTTPSGASVAGELRFSVGGTINTGTGLVAETPYGLEFQVDVTY